jgi:hypothetical protein
VPAYSATGHSQHQPGGSESWLTITREGKVVVADETAVVRAEREAVPEEPPEEASDRGIKHVLEQDVGGVLLLHDAYLEHREPGLHEEDQGSCVW